jgi:hypothetical protein
MNDRTPAKKDLEEDSPEISLNATESTAQTSDSPESKTNEASSLIMDDPTYIAPNQQDMLLLDITANYLHHDLSACFGVQYLSVVPQDEELERYKTRTVHGTIIGNNKRFMVNLPCRRKSNRNYPTSPKAALPFHNVFFIVDTGSPHSYLCPEAISSLVGGNGSPVPTLLKVELLTGGVLDFHVSPSGSHFADVNVLGGSAMAIANLASDNHRDEFFLEFNSTPLPFMG